MSELGAVTKKLNLQDDQVVEDAVRLSKADFMELYATQGYNKLLVGVNWHSIRTSTKGRATFDRLYPAGRDRNSPISFVSDAKAEVEARAQEKEQTKTITTTMEKKEETGKKSTKKREVTAKVTPTQAQEALVGAKVQFSKKGSEDLLTAKVLKVFPGNDGKVYVKLRLDDYSQCLKQADAVKVLEPAP